MKSMIGVVLISLSAGVVLGDAAGLYKQGAAVYESDPAQAFVLFAPLCGQNFGESGISTYSFNRGESWPPKKK